MLIDKNDLEKVIWEIVDEFLIPKFNEYNMNASGEWLGSLDVRRIVENQITIRGADYTRYLVKGRAGGTRPPIYAIEEWVKQKFGYQGSEAKSMAFAVANKIMKEGTRYYPGGTDLLEVLKSHECVKFIQEKIGAVLLESVQLSILRSLKQLS